MYDTNQQFSDAYQVGSLRERCLISAERLETVLDALKDENAPSWIINQLKDIQKYLQESPEKARQGALDSLL